MNAFEIRILDWIQTLRTGAGDTFFSLVTHLGDAGVFWILLCVALLCVKKTRRAGVAMAVALVCDLLLCNVLLKPRVHRIRPYDVNPAIVPIVRKPTDFSFPSGHSAASFAGAAAIFFSGRKKAGIAALVLAAVVALSRLYLYIHYPTDVLGGAAVGVLCGWLGSRACARLARRFPSLAE